MDLTHDPIKLIKQLSERCIGFSCSNRRPDCNFRFDAVLCAAHTPDFVPTYSKCTKAENHRREQCPYRFQRSFNFSEEIVTRLMYEPS